ncbi:MAG: SMP-30/gluconolactonase/LRE family protein [Chloroflexi bacterium]|nr:SMP-30/gluconolactonase/LRE family protein [Chloroflexota bacterium]
MITRSDIHTLRSGIVLGESPRWHDGRLWFCDWLAGEVVAVDLDGRSEVVAHVESFPFSIDWLPPPDGRLVIVSAGGRRVVCVDPDGALIAYAELAGISNRPWNEIVVDGRGNAYVNNIGFDMMGGEEATTGIVALVTPDGSARPVADRLAFPNGMAVTPDNSTLIVAESYGRRLTAFDIEPAGDLSNRRVWAELADGAPDGICIDAEGAIWYGDVPNKRCVRVREGGEVLQTIQLDRGCFACMLGGAHGSTLFMMAAEWNGPGGVGDGEPTGQALCVEALAPHAGWP